MAIVTTDNENYINIANAIRAKVGVNATYKPSEMAVAIENISGGIPCTLAVTTSPGATVTATLDGTVVTATANEAGLAVLVLEKDGVWTVHATDGITENSKNLDTAYSLSLQVGLVGTLEETPWEMISKMSKAGLASRFWNIGDTKTITCNGKAMTAQIIGFDHDDVTDSATYGRAKAGITFQTVECYPSAVNWGSTGIWTNSYIRAYIDKYLFATGAGYEGLGEIKNYIVPVDKICQASVNDTTDTTTISDNLFLLSEYEVFGKNDDTTAKEGSQYAYYAAGNSKIKNANGTAAIWWLRSGQDNNSTYKLAVKQDGKIAYYANNKSYYLAPAFCV